MVSQIMIPALLLFGSVTVHSSNFSEISEDYRSVMLRFSPLLRIPPGAKRKPKIRWWRYDSWPDEELLRVRLFRKYYSLVRPVRPGESKSQVSVEMRLSLQEINYVDEVLQIIEYTFWLELSWKDYRLAWDPDDYNGLRILSLPRRRVWAPDVVIFRSADIADIRNTQGRRATIDHTGTVKLFPHFKLHMPCQMDFSLYPFDEHSCHIVFGSWSYDSEQVALHNMTPVVDTSHLVQSEKWDILGTRMASVIGRHLSTSTFGNGTRIKDRSHSHMAPVSCVQVGIKIRRRLPLTQVVNIFLPCSLILSVTLMTFQLPMRTGEKTFLGIQAQLPLLILFFLVAQSTPRSSDFTPIITRYLLSMLTLAGCIVVAQVVITGFHHTLQPVPRWLRYVAITRLASILRLNTKVIMLRKKTRHKKYPSKRSTLRVLSKIKLIEREIIRQKLASNARNDNCRSHKRRPLEKSSSLPPQLPHFEACQGNFFEQKRLKYLLDSVSDALTYVLIRIESKEVTRTWAKEWHVVSIVLDQLSCYLFIVIFIGANVLLLVYVPFVKHLEHQHNSETNFEIE